MVCTAVFTNKGEAGTQNWDDKYDSEEDLLNSFNDDYEICGACNPSLGKKGKQDDYSAILMLVRDAENGKMYALDADIQKRTLNKLVDDIVDYCQKRNCGKFVVESNGFHEMLADVAQEKLNREGVYTDIEKITHNSDKITRIRLLETKIKNGTIQFSRRHRLLIEQLKYFPKGLHDDGPDALEMAYQAAKEGGNNSIWFGL